MSSKCIIPEPSQFCSRVSKQHTHVSGFCSDCGALPYQDLIIIDDAPINNSHHGYRKHSPVYSTPPSSSHNFSRNRPIAPTASSLFAGVRTATNDRLSKQGRQARGPSIGTPQTQPQRNLVTSASKQQIDLSIFEVTYRYEGLRRVDIGMKRILPHTFILFVGPLPWPERDFIKACLEKLRPGDIPSDFKAQTDDLRLQTGPHSDHDTKATSNRLAFGDVETCEEFLSLVTLDSRSGQNSRPLVHIVRYVEEIMSADEEIPSVKIKQEKGIKREKAGPRATSHRIKREIKSEAIIKNEEDSIDFEDNLFVTDNDGGDDSTASKNNNKRGRELSSSPLPDLLNITPSEEARIERNFAEASARLRKSSRWNKGKARASIP